MDMKGSMTNSDMKNSGMTNSGMANSGNSAVEVIDLGHYWNVVRRQLKKIIALSIVTTLIAILVVFSLTPKYSATSTLLIEASESKIVSIEEVYGLNGGNSEYLLTQFEILKSRDMAKRVVEKLELVNYAEFNPYHASNKKGFSLKTFILGEGDAEPPTQEDIINKTTDVFWDAVSVSPVRKTQLVKISVMSESPALAQKAANAMSHAYIESQLEAKVGLTQQASEWLTKRLGGLKESLSASEKKLQAFREANNLVDVQGVSTLVADELGQITSKLVDARSIRLEVESNYNQIKRLEKLDYESLTSLQFILADPLISRLTETQSNTELKVAELSKRYGAKHPKMIAAQSDLDAVKESVLSQMKKLATGIENSFATAKAKEASLLKSLEITKKKMRDINRTEFALGELVRAVKGDRALYETFFKRIRETSATGDLQTANARIVDSAVVPQHPVKPKKKLIVALVLVVSLMFGIALAFLLDALDSTIKNADDIDHKLGFSVLGIIPLLPKVALKGAQKDQHKTETNNTPVRAFVHGDNHPFKESIRTLRTSLTLASLENPAKCLLFTSSIPGEGKTTSSVNLASAYGQMERTLLIDADMRRPSVAKQLRLPAGFKGLSNAVAYPETLDESIHHIEDLNIDVMPSGVIPPNPLELLASKNFETILTTLRSRYDRIIIDSPPIGAVSDALYLSTLTDGLVYVIKADSTKDKLIKTGLARLDQSNARILGVVLNQLDTEKEYRYNTANSGYYDSYEYHEDRV
jgi:capsular exopolysaccharide synthesis family protein